MNGKKKTTNAILEVLTGIWDELSFNMEKDETSFKGTVNYKDMKSTVTKPTKGQAKFSLDKGDK